MGKRQEKKIPFVNKNSISLNLTFDLIPNSNENYNDYFDYSLYPQNVLVPANGIFLLNLIIRPFQDKKIEKKNISFKYILTFKLKNSTSIISFPVIIEII